MSPHFVGVDVLGGRRQQLADRGVVALRRPPDRLRLDHVVALRVVAEQMEADLDRIGRGEVLDERRHRARLRRRVDEAEQERRGLLGQQLGGLAEQLGRNGGTKLLDPGRPELVRVLLVLDEERRDAEQQLRRLRGVDLDRSSLARARDVDDARLLDGAGLLGFFDRHRTVTRMIPRFRELCLTSPGTVR